MTNEEKIKQITRWQNCDCVHPLTCGSDDCSYVVLEAIEKDGDVILTCPECGYKQAYLPDCVLTADLDTLEDGYKKMMRHLKGKSNG